MFGNGLSTTTRPGRNSSINSSRSTSETPCTHPQSEEDHAAEPAAKDASKDIKVAKGLGSSNPNHMNMIDKLHELGVGAVIPLPQLVVVGDQSSGKSSVLEAITEFPFARDDGLCTRFATNIVFKRSPETSISVSIVPENKNIFNAAKLNSFRRDKIEKLDELTFLDILDEVCSTLNGRA